jgi:hypothetical protein
MELGEGSRIVVLTREFKQTVAARLQRDRAFRKAILVEGVQLLLDGDIENGKAILRDYMSATWDSSDSDEK